MFGNEHVLSGDGRSDDRVALPIRLVRALDERAAQPPDDGTSRRLEQEGTDGVDQTGEATADHLQAEAGGLAAMDGVALIYFSEVPSQGIVRHGPFLSPGLWRE